MMLSELRATFNDTDVIECKRTLNSISKLGKTIPKQKLIEQAKKDGV